MYHVNVSTEVIILTSSVLFENYCNVCDVWTLYCKYRYGPVNISHVYLDKLFSIVHCDIMLAIRESFPNGEQIRKSEIFQPNADDRKFLMNRNYFSGSFNHQQLPEWLIEKYFQSQQ